MKISLASLLLLATLLALSATAVAGHQPDSIPLAPAENRRPADWQSSSPATRPYRTANAKGTSSSKSVMTKSKYGRFVYVILKKWLGAPSARILWNQAEVRSPC